ncbi:sigma-54-dependent transcriptional regulator [Blastopirellula marina]|uniref:Probable two-component system response regulator (Ntr family protein) n=1 Tax=Blastopirellula marina DSM 3645 TaxID=314230 RepID=A3ZYB0_9BACT|nr:sigma-54 dependent transcriptional regulator [Blastopirellula marina]EAQ78586.1 probable two-component system response regulator (Ntr family protein) [Blastopirellula marina DSM 3645]
MHGKILIVDDQQSMCELIQTDLKLRSYESSWFTSAEAAFHALKEDDFDAVLTDIRMPGASGIQLCEQIVANRPDVPVIVMTAFGSLETAVAAIRAGAFDFVTKPIEMDLLAISLERAVKHRRLQQQVKLLGDAVDHSRHFGEIIGESPPMQKLFDQISRIGQSSASVLITGESGTGKELVARLLHRQSRRADGPFVAINCAALPEALLESELFGHAKGAFTDARAERKGLFQQAEKGTLLLDEIGEMPISMQVKLLRALEENKLRPVGGDQEIEFDVRILAATNRDLEAAVEDQKFRDDLFYRINVIQLELPPLRSRGTDILLLARHFVTTHAKRAEKSVANISEQASERLLAYSWPGNVRELRNVIERAVALTRYEMLAVEDLPDKIRDYRGSQVFIGGEDPAELAPMDEVERRYILHVLSAVGDNKTTAARILGLDRKTLYRKLKQYGVEENI